MGPCCEHPSPLPIPTLPCKDWRAGPGLPTGAQSDIRQRLPHAGTKSSWHSWSGKRQALVPQLPPHSSPCFLLLFSMLACLPTTVHTPTRSPCWLRQQEKRSHPYSPYCTMPGPPLSPDDLDSRFPRFEGLSGMVMKA